MQIEIRLATPNDAEELSKLNQEFNGGDRRALSDIIDSLNQSKELVAIVLVNGEAVGFACAQSFTSFCYREPQGEITEMYVRDKARRMGLATALISFLEAELEVRGVKTIKVITGWKNEAAIKAYERSEYVRQDDVVLEKNV